MYAEAYGPHEVMLNIDGINSYTKMMITCDKDLAGQIYVCSEELEQNPNSQGAAILERSFSITKWPLRQCLVEYFCYTNHNPQGEETAIRTAREN